LPDLSINGRSSKKDSLAPLAVGAVVRAAATGALASSRPQHTLASNPRRSHEKTPVTPPPSISDVLTISLFVNLPGAHRLE